MFEIKEQPKLVERALLVGIYEKGQDEAEAADLLQELEELVGTLGIPVADRMLVRIPAPQARLFIGTGKANEIVERVKAADLDVIIFDNELSPAQQRNWEKLSGVCVIDRQEVILDIFARRAQTKEARLQVDLARMEYNLPRLTRAWAHLGRQGGAAVGAKGEGETQLEIDRRLTRRRIDRLKADLELVRKQRATQRKDRTRLPTPHAAIVGYTNAGKSSLLKKFTGADVLVEDKLFATLDTTTRRIQLPDGQPLLLTDTVGFVRRLPHGLVESFKATLEESLLADFLIHVLDASQDRIYEIHETTLRVLSELGAAEKPALTVLNKIDKIDRERLHHLRLHFPEACCISVRTGEGLEELCHRMADQMAGRVVRMSLRIPQERSDFVALLHREAKICSTRYEGNDILVESLIPFHLESRAREFEVREELSAAPEQPPSPSVIERR